MDFYYDDLTDRKETGNSRGTPGSRLKDIYIDKSDVLKSLPSGEMSVHWSGGRISSATQRVSDRCRKRKRRKKVNESPGKGKAENLLLTANMT